MPKYIIEREIPGAGKLTSEQLKGISQTIATQKIKIAVDGMVCTACLSTVKKTIKSLNGVKDVEVSLENKNAFITFYPNLTQPEKIQKAINDKGYTAGKPQEVKQ